MHRLLEILASLILLSHPAAGTQHGDVLVINDASFTHQNAYEVVPPTDRVKRDQSPWFFPDIDKEHIACGQNVYVKLFTCSNLKDCRTFSSCLDSLRCPLSVKSNGGLILNLLRQLGMDKCNDDDANQQCPHDKRLSILKRFFAFWSHNKDDNYCRTFPIFTEEIKKDIQEQCPLSLHQVETFLENYACSPLKDALASLTSTTPHTGDVHEQAHLPSIDNPSTTAGTVISSQFAYIDEDNDLKFVNTNKNLFNNTEQTVIVNDHRYYNASYIIPKSEGNLGNFVHDNSQFVRIHALSKRHRSAFGIALKFGFPFYGHTIHKVLVATGGFIYTGELLHSALIGSTQYIAPFMANFDASIGDNETGISYFDNSTHFICTWNRVYLQDQKEAGPFTFQTILQNTGNIYFNYLQLPKVKVSSANHAHRIGLSDAYLSQHSTNEHIVRVITLYDKINLDKDKIQSGVSVVFDMDQTCNTFTDCSSCLANRGIRYNCSWCDDIHKCSDGLDRSHQQWMRSQCHRLASESTCPNSLEDAYDDSHVPSSTIAPSVVQLERRKSLSTSTSHHLSTFRTIVVTLLLSVLILSLVTMGVTYIYAYRNPMSPAGMWLLEHRPSTYIARFKRFTGSN